MRKVLFFAFIYLLSVQFLFAGTEPINASYNIRFVKPGLRFKAFDSSLHYLAIKPIRGTDLANSFYRKKTGINNKDNVFSSISHEPLNVASLPFSNFEITDGVLLVRDEGGGAGTATGKGFVQQNRDAMYIGSLDEASPVWVYAGQEVKMSVLGNGNVGIGTKTPANRLDIIGTATTDPLQNVSACIGIYDNRTYNSGMVGGAIRFGGQYTSGNARTTFAGIRGVKSDSTNGNYDGQLEFFTRSSNDDEWTGDQRMVIKATGYIGIGTLSPTEKLSVNGNVYANGNMSANGNVTAKKITVTQIGWSDYVFNDDYKLRSLSSLESYLKQNKHLPEIPSAKEVEEKGISVGDNQALLLKKIEELTLYMIEMNKSNNQMMIEIKAQEKEIQLLKNKK